MAQDKLSMHQSSECQAAYTSAARSCVPSARIWKDPSLLSSAEGMDTAEVVAVGELDWVDEPRGAALVAGIHSATILYRKRAKRDL